LERFLFSRGEICYRTKPAKILLNLQNSCVKRLFSDRFNISCSNKKALMKSRIKYALYIGRGEPILYTFEVDCSCIINYFYRYFAIFCLSYRIVTFAYKSDWPVIVTTV